MVMMSRSQKPSQDMSRPVLSSTSPAWHIHKGVRSSMDNYTSPDTPPPLPESEQIIGTRRAQMDELPHPAFDNQASQNPIPESVPARSSSLQNPQHRDRPVSGTQPQNPTHYPHTVTRRKDSFPQNRHSRKISPNHRKRESQTSTQPSRSAQQSFESAQRPVAADDRVNPSQLPVVQPDSNGLSTEIDQALAGLSVDEQIHQATHPRKSADISPETMENLRLPPDFDLGSSTKTSIDTKWRAAVTHEEKRLERTEIVQEAITRDIHIHHYYTYIQPIKVVEVLPAKHYMYDEKTGVRVEIPSPPGWQMPTHLQPHSPDTSGLTGWSRHYLVNEQHPNGIAEQPPVNEPPIHPQKGTIYSSRQVYRGGY